MPSLNSTLECHLTTRRREAAWDVLVVNAQAKKYAMLTKIFKRSKGDKHTGNARLYCRSSSAWLSYLHAPGRLDKSHIQSRSRQHKRCDKLWLIGNKGTSRIEIVIYLTLLMFFVFGSIDFTVTLLRHMQAEQIKHEYIDRMRIEGYLSQTAFLEMQERFENIGMTIVGIEGTVANVSSAIENNTLGGGFVEGPVTRNAENINASQISLLIELEPGRQPFFSGRLIGQNAGEDFTFTAGGVAFSELPKSELP